MKLSEHFSLAEATKSQTALRLGISNVPPDRLLPALALVAKNILEPVRAEFGRPFSPSSWYRSPELNEAIGGAATSQHVKGEAVDFEAPGVPNLEVARFIVKNLIWDQLILEYAIDSDPYSGWVHASYCEGRNRQSVLRFDGKTYKMGLTDD